MKPIFDVNAKGDGSNQPIYEEIGRFRYLADHTRLDLLASVSIMGSSIANPHDERVKGVHTFEVYLFGFSDAAYLTRLAYCFFLKRTLGCICAKNV
jgi:hypothetical protein